jgi:glycosyltransferase involved in cell wall biosynthesis
MPSFFEEKLIGRLPFGLGARLNERRLLRIRKHGEEQLHRILELTRPDTIYLEYFSLGLSLSGALASFPGPKVAHCHGFDVTSALNAEGARCSVPAMVEAMDHFIVTSEHIRNRVRILGVPESKITKVKLGVEVLGVAAVPWDVRLAANYVVSLGRLTSKKSPITALIAFKALAKDFPSLRYKLIGDGDLMSEVRRAVEVLGLGDRVDLMGALKHKDALNILSGSRLYIQHSATGIDGDQEGFGVSIAEASLLGLPVVSTLHNGIPEQVLDGKTGYLVPEYAIDAFANRMRRFLESPQLSQEIGSAGCERIASVYQKDRRIKEIEALLTQKNKMK